MTSRDASGRLEGELFGNGMNTKRVFDPYTGDLLAIETGVAKKLIRNIRYTYNKRSSVTNRTDAINNISEGFRYDTLDRLAYWSYNNPRGANHSHTYTYDVHGNMESKTGAGTMSYDGGNRLTQRVANGKTFKYAYDKNGNMRTGDGRTYTWTAFNKAQSVQTAQGTTSYQYDGQHNRAVKQEDGTTTYYFGRDYEVIVETNAKGQKLRRMRHHIFVDDQLVATHEKTMIDQEKQIDSTAYVHRDALGSVDTVTNQIGQIIQQQRYTPFGEDLDFVEAKNNHYRRGEIRGYTSHENVGETGLINMNARLYDPVIARFVQADSMIPEPGNVQSYNRYAYVINNPMKYSDPSGHFWQFLVGLALYTFSMTTDDPFLQKITSIAGMALMGNALPSGGFVQVVQNGATLGFIRGTAQGGLSQGLKQGAMGGLTAGLTFGVAESLNGVTGGNGHGFGPLQVMGQMAVGGIIAELQGGKFAHGAAAAFGSKVSTHVSAKLLSHIHSTFEVGEFGGAALSMVFGGIISEASGGSFEDGAMQALFTHLYNDGRRACAGRPCRNKGSTAPEYSMSDEKFKSITGMTIEDSISLYKAQTGDTLSVDQVKRLFTDPTYAGEQLMSSENLHKVYRSILNSNIPQTATAAKSANFVQLPAYKSIFHNPWYNPWRNSKWVVGPHGYLEGVYNGQGNLVSSNDYLGTFNFFGPDHASAHTAADVKPYFKWGN